MPLESMLFGLIDYNIRFFTCNSTQMLGIEDHYVTWLETTHSNFGNKFLCLFRGPTWQYEEEDTPIVENHVNSSIPDSVQPNQSPEQTMGMSLIQDALI